MWNDDLFLSSDNLDNLIALKITVLLNLNNTSLLFQSMFISND